MPVVIGDTSDPKENAILAMHLNTPILGRLAPEPGGSGIRAITDVAGAAGVFGVSSGNNGVGVHGEGLAAGVRGFSDQRSGVLAQSNRGSGVVCTSDTGHGLDAFSTKDIAVFAQGWAFSGVFQGALVVNKCPSPYDPEDPSPNKVPESDINGSIVINEGHLFLNNNGHLYVDKGDVSCRNADAAEEFDVAGGAQTDPGTVMVLDDNGGVAESSKAYDKRVAGIISGAGNYRPALVLDRQLGAHGRVPLALIGKVYCKVDSEYSPIEVGDLLTTSFTPGHAMKADDPLKAFGAVIGKALRPCRSGRSLIPVLVALQ